MKVSEQDVAYVAELANLELTAEERAGMLHDLNSILDYMDLLNDLDTSNVEPMAQVTGDEISGPNVEGRHEDGRNIAASREDIVEGLRPSLPHRVAMENAPDTDGTFFQVPKVIER